MGDRRKAGRWVALAMAAVVGVAPWLAAPVADATGFSPNVREGSDIVMSELRWPRWDQGTCYCQPLLDAALRPSLCGELHDPGRMELASGTAAAGVAARAGPVAQAGGQQRLAPHEGGEQTVHLGVDGLETVAEVGEAGLYHRALHALKPRRCRAPFPPIG